MSLPFTPSEGRRVTNINNKIKIEGKMMELAEISHMTCYFQPQELDMTAWLGDQSGLPL